MFSAKISQSGAGRISIAVLVIVVICLAEIVLLKYCFEWLVGFSLWGRIMLGLVITAGPAFFMGIPFPTALTILHAHKKPLIPWAWAVNGFASVTGAVLGTFLAISVGFTNKKSE